MCRRREEEEEEYDMNSVAEDDNEGGEPLDDSEDDEEEEEYQGRKRRQSSFIDDIAEKDDDEEDEDYGGGGSSKKKRKIKEMSRAGAQFLDLEAQVDSDEEEEEDGEEGEDDFIVDTGADLPDEDFDDTSRRMHRRPPPPIDQEEDFEALERRIQERYGRRELEFDDLGDEGEVTEVDQQSLLPSVRDPKLWMVKCAIGHEREIAVCLMQKCIQRGSSSSSNLQIRSVIALDHLKNFIYIEADKEAHVREAIKGMRKIYGSKITLVPIKEMTDVLSVESKPSDLVRDAWVRMKIGTYKGDIAKVVDVDNVKQKVTVKLIPRIDLQALADKSEGINVENRKKGIIKPPRLMNIEEARAMHIRVERRRNRNTGDYFETIGPMMFKDGFLYKTMSIKSINTVNIQPTFDEREKFQEDVDSARGGDNTSMSMATLLSNRKKGHFLKGDKVIVVKGDLKNLKGTVEKVEIYSVHIKSQEYGLNETLEISEKYLCKYFEPGNHVKVVTGATEGATGMVASIEGHIVNLVSDTTKGTVSVFADHVVQSSEVTTTGLNRIGDYELNDLVQLDDMKMSFGVIIRIEENETAAFQILKGIPDKPEVALVRLREIKFKIPRRRNNYSQDSNGNKLAVKDIVKILEGQFKDKQGTIEHIYRGIVFVHDRYHLKNAGFICAKSNACRLIGGRDGSSQANKANYGYGYGRPRPHLHPRIRTFSRSSDSGPGRSITRQSSLSLSPMIDLMIGKSIKIRKGNYKGCSGRIKEVKGNTFRVELESQMKMVIVNRDDTFEDNNNNNNVENTSFRGNETPIHPSETPLRSCMTPIHDGMRTPRHDHRAWNPYTTMDTPMHPSRSSTPSHRSNMTR